MLRQQYVPCRLKYIQRDTSNSKSSTFWTMGNCAHSEKCVLFLFEHSYAHYYTFNNRWNHGSTASASSWPFKSIAFNFYSHSTTKSFPSSLEFLTSEKKMKKKKMNTPGDPILILRVKRISRDAINMRHVATTKAVAELRAFVSSSSSSYSFSYVCAHKEDEDEK